MTELLNMAEVGINTAKTWVEKFINSLSESMLTTNGMIRQDALSEHKALIRLQAAVKVIDKILATAIAKRDEQLVELRKDNRVATGKLTAKVKTSTRISVKYKEVLCYYTPLLSRVFKVNDYEPDEFHILIKAEIKDKMSLTEHLANIPKSVSEKIEIL